MEIPIKTKLLFLFFALSIIHNLSAKVFEIKWPRVPNGSYEFALNEKNRKINGRQVELFFANCPR
jgi:hypothetical protein